MNQRGNLLLIILLAFLAFAVLVPLVMYFFKPADIIMRIILVFFIFSLVRGLVGSGTISLIISAVLIYFLVIKYAYIAASVYVLWLLLGFGFFSVIIWGLGMNLRR